MNHANTTDTTIPRCLNRQNDIELCRQLLESRCLVCYLPCACFHSQVSENCPLGGWIYPELHTEWLHCFPLTLHCVGACDRAVKSGFGTDCTGSASALAYAMLVDSTGLGFFKTRFFIYVPFVSLIQSTHQPFAACDCVCAWVNSPSPVECRTYLPLRIFIIF